MGWKKTAEEGEDKTASDLLDCFQQPNVQMITVPPKSVCVCVWSDTDARASLLAHADMPVCASSLIGAFGLHQVDWAPHAAHVRVRVLRKYRPSASKCLRACSCT